jgi:hypothetical protein
MVKELLFFPGTWRTTIMFTRDSHWTFTLNSVQIFAHLISKDFVTSLMLTVSAKWPSPSWYTARNSACISRLPLTCYVSQHSHSPWFDFAENLNHVTHHYAVFTFSCLLGWHILLSTILTLFTRTEREDFIPVQKKLLKLYSFPIYFNLLGLWWKMGTWNVVNWRYQTFVGINLLTFFKLETFLT